MLEFEKEIKAALEVMPSVSEIRNTIPAGSEYASTVYVETAEKLGHLMRDLSQVLGVRADENSIAATVRHEGQHFNAAQIIGTEFSRFGLQIFTLIQKSPGVCWIPFQQNSFRHDITPLEIASVAAYPVELSVGDVESMQSLGFENVEELAERAIWNNRTTSRHIPVPLSYRLK
ncbi:MAG TPA: hypothetical protein PKD20_04665 [Candidatus Saccharibacteria bacterium]|jgi:hypothetical protein|nr:hypothetical protein [Candidatus Saccharibacteria bacterium]HMT56137.1 hypothetical protein [Candidatus Saccharibacteria bacterium]